MDETFEKKIVKTSKKPLLNILLIIGFLLVIYFNFFRATDRQKDVVIHIGSDRSASEIVEELKSKNIIRSKFILKSIIYVWGDKNISRGDYLFKKDKNLISVAYQIISAKHGVEKVRITIKEGMTKNQIADLLADRISVFRKDLFLSDSRALEGYLFPDTYFFYPMSTNDEILDEITANFDKKIKSLENDIEKSGKNISDIIIMASILEKEAKGGNDAPYISGILWKRINIGMALQVDAAPVTYDEAGLPPKPICNPGLISIKAAINPKNSSYLFYLHDDDGQVHYAEDFSEHRSNIAHYLK